MLRYIIGISILTAGLMIIRALTNGKILKKHQYAFWIVIPLCMILFPFVKIDIPVLDNIGFLFPSETIVTTSGELPDSSPDTARLEADIIPGGHVIEQTDSKAKKEADRSSRPEQVPVQKAGTTTLKVKEDLNIGSIVKNISFVVSSVLIALLVIYNTGFALYCRRKRRFLRRDPSSGLKIYCIRHRATPFLLFNKIYVEEAEDANEYIICHEACHYKHGDFIWVLIRYIVLFINWYNPVIWAAFILSGRDSELACDEEVLRILGNDSSAGYVDTLIDLLERHCKTPFAFNISIGMSSGFKTMRKRILNIKRPAGMSRRVLALSLAAIMLFSSCSFINTSKNVEKVAEDTPWFDSEVTKADLGLDLSRDLEKHQILTAGCDDKYTVIVLSGCYRPQEEEEEGDCILNVVVIDRAKKTVEKLDLSDRVSETVNIKDAFYSNGKLTLMMNKSNPDTYETSQLEEDIDIRSGNVVETRPLGEPIESVFTIGEYRINVLKKGPFDKPFYVLTWNTSDGEGKEVTIKEKDTILNGIPVIIPMTESQVLVPVNTERETLYYEVDLKGEKLTPADPKDYDWLDIDHMKTYCFGSDLKTYFIEDNSGIKCIDLVNKMVENYVDFNWCGVNRSLIANSNIVSIDGDSVLLGGQKRGNYFMATDVVKAMSEYYLVKITKADKNPHAGKTVLTLYMDDEMAEEEVNDAVITFNNTNGGYYIKETYKYVKDYTELYEEQSDDELNLAILNMNIDVTDQLTQDIINGKGPDILINTNDLGILNNENYLADLSPYFSDLDPSNYYTNIVEASRFGGKLYQMPVSLRIVGIGANHKYGGKSDIGFTFEEYKDFVNGILNGRDPLGKGRIRYFFDLFNAMSDRFIKDGKADFSCPEFAELANYVKDNVQDKDDSREDEEYDPAPSDVRSSSIYCFGLSSYFEELWNYDGDFEIFGYPSADGRGPQSEAWISAAVSSQTVNVDACADFVKLLLSDEIQKGLAEKDYIVLNRLAFRENGIQAAEFFSGRGANRLIWNGYSSPKDHLKYTEKDIDELEKIIMSCSKNSSEDPAITIILQEEMPAFFLGQKDLDSVIRIAQNRVQTLLDERKSKGKSSIARNNDSEESPVS